MPENLRNLEHKIGYYFNDQKILKEAMTHGSSRAQNLSLPHHERLEFLGDSVLYLIISEYLFQIEGNASPGKLTELRKVYISDQRQNEIAREIEIHRYVEMSSCVRSFGRYGEFIEALLGAVYIDAGKVDGMGLKKVKAVVFKLWGLEPPPSTGCVIF